MTPVYSKQDLCELELNYIENLDDNEIRRARNRFTNTRILKWLETNGGYFEHLVCYI